MTVLDALQNFLLTCICLIIASFVIGFWIVSGNPILLIIGLPIASVLLLDAFWFSKLDPLQKLKILVDLPATTPETVPLLLNPADSELFSRLLTRCHVTRENGRLVLRYQRRIQIYYPGDRTFEIDGKEYRPIQLKVLHEQMSKF